MSAVAHIPSIESPRLDHAARIEELGDIIRAYSEVTDKLQQSHNQLQQTVQSLRNELSEKNRLLERKKRLAALGEMAAGMAHEIRNPLGGIQLYASMLANDLQSQSAPLQIVNKISNGVKRLEGLVSQVLQFTREMTAHPTQTDLAELIEQSVELAGHRMQSATVDCQCDGPAPMLVSVDPLLMGQAVLNLFINAVEAIQGNGSIHIVWMPMPAPEQFRITVRDSGPGIPSELLDRIFNPFFTTKDSGTGLGLAIVHRIVEAHDGAIAICNAPQGGAVFEIRI